MTTPDLRSLHIVSSLRLSAGGPTQSITQLCEALNRLGAPAEIATVDCSDPIPWQGTTPIRTFPSAFPKRLGRSPGLQLFLDQETRNFDIIHVHGLWQWPGLYARRAADRAGLPLFISPRGMAQPWALKQGVAQKRLAWILWERNNLKAAAMFHAASPAEAASLRKLGVAQPIAIVPNGQAFPSPPPSFPTERRRLVFLSRLHPSKGVDLLLNAWGRVSPDYPEWDLVLAVPADSSHSRKYARLSQELGLSRISMPGPIYGEEKWTLLRSADVVVLPSHSENFGNVIAEAFSQGVPVITTTGTPWPCIAEQRFGWWVPLIPECLEVALREALSSPPSVLRAMGARGREWVVRELDPMHTASDLVKAYQWILDPSLLRPNCVSTEP